MATQCSDEHRAVRDSSVGEILQSSTTMASIAIAFLAYLHSKKVAIIVPIAIFASGIMALWASILSLIDLLDEQNRSRGELLFPPSSIMLLFWIIIFLAGAFVFIARPDWGNAIALFFERIGGIFRAP